MKNLVKAYNDVVREYRSRLPSTHPLDRRREDATANGQEAGAASSAPAQPKMSRVVDLHLRDDGTRAEFDIYIGRRVRFHPVFTEDSKWGNPFGRSPDSLRLYEQYIRSMPALWDALEELDGKVLGCWCTNTSSVESPLRCHGQVLMKLLQEKRRTES